MSKSTAKVKKKYADTYKWTDDEVDSNERIQNEANLSPFFFDHCVIDKIVPPCSFPSWSRPESPSVMVRSFFLLFDARSYSVFLWLFRLVTKYFIIVSVWLEYKDIFPETNVQGHSHESDFRPVSNVVLLPCRTQMKLSFRLTLGSSTPSETIKRGTAQFSSTWLLSTAGLAVPHGSSTTWFQMLCYCHTELNA